MCPQFNINIITKTRMQKIYILIAATIIIGSTVFTRCSYNNVMDKEKEWNQLEPKLLKAFKPENWDEFIHEYYVVPYNKLLEFPTYAPSFIKKLYDSLTEDEELRIRLGGAIYYNVAVIGSDV
jgi:hypothetical protein